jgi:hypothetical protein
MSKTMRMNSLHFLNFFMTSLKKLVYSFCISNLKWYQPSEDTTVVKQYGPQAKNKRIKPFLDRSTKKFHF